MQPGKSAYISSAWQTLCASEKLSSRAAYTFLTLLTVSWAIIGRKDLNFDQLNYHYFLPYSLLTGRIDQDLLPANSASFLNPVAYIPFYWMVAHEWHSIAITIVLAAIHSLNLIVVYKMTYEIFGNSIQQHWRTTLALFAAIFALLSPIYLLEVGTSFADITTSIFVLLAMLQGLRSDSNTKWKRSILIAGISLGIAIGLKLSNIIYSLPCLILVAQVQPTIKRAGQAILLLAVGSTIGLIFANGYWGWQMWTHYHNPFYPFFDNYLNPGNFRPEESANLERFLPETIADYFTLPFRMLKLRSWIYMENVAPDTRFALLIVVVIFGISRKLYAKYNLAKNENLTPHKKSLALGVFFALSYIIWLSISGNGRYGMPIMLICGSALVTAMTYFFKTTRVTTAWLTAIVIAQGFHLSNGDLRWTYGGWTTTWYAATMPDRLKRDPFFYLSIGNNSNSFLYPFLAPQSAFTNPIGQSSIELASQTKEKFDALRTKFAGRIRVIAAAQNAHANKAVFNQWIIYTDALISRFNFAIDDTDCEWITTDGGVYVTGSDFDPKADRTRRFLTCALVDRPFQLAAERMRMTKIVKDIVAWCPKLFKPARTVLERIPNGWSAMYLATDSRIIIYGKQILTSQNQAAADILLGTVDDWEHGITPSCEKLPNKPRKAYTF